MKRLTLDELKTQKNQKNVVLQLEAVKGGNANGCHCCSENPGPVIHAWDRPKVVVQK